MVVYSSIFGTIGVSQALLCAGSLKILPGICADLQGLADGGPTVVRPKILQPRIPQIEGIRDRAKILTGSMERLLGAARGESPLSPEEAGQISSELRETLDSLGVPDLDSMQEQLQEMTSKLKEAEKRYRDQAHELRERIKELRCLYEISEFMRRTDIIQPTEFFDGVVHLIPPAWRYPEICCARILYKGEAFTTDNWEESEWMQSAVIEIDEDRIVQIDVAYLEERDSMDEGPFLKHERSLIDAIAIQLGQFIQQRRAKQALKASEARLESRLDIEAAVSRISHMFLTQEEVNINEVLEELARAIHADRASIFRIEGRAMSITYQYSAPGIERQTDDYQNLPTAAYSWFIGQMGKGRNVIAKNLDDLPEDSAERKFLDEKDIQSFIAVPLIDRNRRLIGFLGLSDTRKQHAWSGYDADAMRVVTEMIVRYIERGESARTQAELEEQVRQAQRMEDSIEMGGRMANKINNALHVIGGRVDLALGRLPGMISQIESSLENFRSGRYSLADIIAFAGNRFQEMNEDLDEMRRDLGEAIEALKGLKAFVSGVKSLSELEGYDPRVTDIYDILRSVRNQLRENEKFSSSINLKLIGEAGCFAKVDRNKIEEVLLQLGINALDAVESKSEGNIWIKVKRVRLFGKFCEERLGLAEGEYVRITVQDDGDGIPPGSQEEVFEPLFTTKTEAEVMGLGLSKAYSTIKAHEGDIVLESAPDQGTTFTVYLPYSEEGAGTVFGKQDIARMAAIGKGKKVLVVDDDALVRRVVGKMLKRHGFTVLVAENGREGIELLRKEKPDVVLLDYVMPEICGLETLIKMREVGGSKIILSSGNLQHTDEEIEELGGAGSIEKPYDIQSLLEKFRKIGLLKDPEEERKE